MEFHTAIESYYDKIQDHTANGAVFAAVCRGKVGLAMIYLHRYVMFMSIHCVDRKNTRYFY